MLSEEKIKLMTDLALYEKHEGKKIFPFNHYFKSDYISSKLFCSFFSYTLSFLLCFAVWTLFHMETWLNTARLEVLTGAGIRAGVLYCVGLVVYLSITVWVCIRKYGYALQGMKAYQSKLKRLDKKYEGNTRPLKRIKGGRNL